MVQQAFTSNLTAAKSRNIVKTRSFRRDLVANIHIDSLRCTGCMNCQVVCSLVHFGKQDPSLSAVRIMLDPFGGNHSHVYCRQCTEPACEAACPENAISSDPETGVPVVNNDLCVLCGMCADACPFHAVFISEAADHAVKCDLCHGKPACIEACQFDVIELRN